MIQNLKKQKIIISLLSLVLLALTILLLSEFVKDSEEVKYFIFNYGYIGLLFVSVISGFNVLIPIPIITFLPILVFSGLSFWGSIIIITVGMTLGDSLGFLLGRIGRKTIDQDKLPKFLRKCEGYLFENPKIIPIAVFLYASFAPIPNELLVIPLSFFERKWWHILAPVLAGNMVFNTLAAFGVASIFGII